MPNAVSSGKDRNSRILCQAGMELPVSAYLRRAGSSCATVVQPAATDTSCPWVMATGRC